MSICNYYTLIICLKHLDPEPPRTVTKVKKELFTPEKESPPGDIVKPEIPDTPPEVVRDSIPASLPTVFVMNTAKQVCSSSVKVKPPSHVTSPRTSFGQDIWPYEMVPSGTISSPSAGERKPQGENHQALAVKGIRHPTCGPESESIQA